MANLVSPGTQVQITDESVYGSAGAGTVPMIFIATGEDKVDPTGTAADGVAQYTTAATSGSPILVTSQRELTQYFGNTDFRTVSGTVQQGDETNDYGLLAAYSFLGQASAAYVVRANVDLTALRPQDAEPSGDPAASTYWVNPVDSNFGIFEFDGSNWNAVTPNVEVVSTAGSATTAVVVGEYLVEMVEGAAATSLEYYIGTTGAPDTWESVVATFAPHYSAPVSPSANDIWVKTTQPGAGLDVDVSLFSAEWIAQTAIYAQATAPTGTTADTFHDGTAATARTISEGDLWLDIDTSSIVLKKYESAAWVDVVYTISTTAPTGNPTDGTIWFNDEVDGLDIFEVAIDGSEQKWQKVENVTYASGAPSVGADGDYWIDTDASGYPLIYRSNGSAWVQTDNTDQTTSNGVVFGDITADLIAANLFVASGDVLADGPNPLLFPVGTSAINMNRSTNTVRQYDSSLTTTWKWRNMAGNHADGSGAFGRKAQRKVVVEAMQSAASASVLREETIAFRLIAAPGYPEMFDEMNTLSADRGETAFTVADAPFRLNPTEAISWVQGNGAVENGENGLIGRDSNAAVYYPSVYTTDPTTGASVVAPASHSVLYTYAYNDNVSYQWFAPAGLTRGVVQNASNVGYINAEGDFTPVALTQGHRDSMYENELNPIVNFPAEGIIVFGQKTLASGASALDRVNVARLVAYLRERFSVISRPYLFEPNDDATRKNVEDTFNGFLSNIRTQRGVYDYSVVCDTTNNTPARVDANEIWVDIAIEPTKSAEFIYIPVRIVNTGEIG